MHNGVGELQELVEKDSADSQSIRKSNEVKMCQLLRTLLAERVVRAREDQIRKTGCVAGLYVQSRKNRLDLIKQLTDA